MNAHAFYLDQMSVLSVPKLIKLPSLVDQFAYYLVPIEVRLFRSLLRVDVAVNNVLPFGWNVLLGLPPVLSRYFQHPLGGLVARGFHAAGDHVERSVVLLRVERDARARVTRPTRPPRPVNIVGAHARTIEIEDGVDAQNVHASGHEIRGD